MNLNETTIAYIKKMFGLDTLAFLDYETFYKSKADIATKSFSLKSKTYAEYILDPQGRFHVTGLGVAEDMSPVEYVHEADEVQALIDEYKARREQGERIGVVAHNVQFDASVSNWTQRLNWDAYFCTKMMRTLLHSDRSSSLKAACLDMWPNDESLNKGGEELADVDGISYPYITSEQHQALEKYCIQDVNLCRNLFLKYVPDIVSLKLQHELVLMHINARGAVEPQFMIARELLEEVLTDEELKKKRVLAAAKEVADMYGLTCTDKTFSSNPQYAELLEKLGMEVPLKVSPTTGLLAPALGKNDPPYIKAQIKHPQLAAIFKARDTVKSTISASRATRMIDVADKFHDEGFEQADMPFFLNYFGAKQTGRWSGGQKVNQQNNTRGGKHRLSMLAPPGHQIAVCDLSNIEVRVNMWICGQQDILDQMASTDHMDPKDPLKYDYYCDVASPLFGRALTKSADKDERQMGKVMGLGLGFAMGWSGFQDYLASGALGMDPMFKDDDYCKKVKHAYEQKHPMVVKMWRFLSNNVEGIIVMGGELAFGPNGSFIARKDSIELPSGRFLKYPNARYEGSETQNGYQQRAIFDSDKTDRFNNAVPKGMWHGLLIENLAQATARDVMAEQIVQVENTLQREDYGWVMGSVHDEILAAVKFTDADYAFQEMQSCMSKPPPWGEDIPLANEGGYAREYSK